MPRSFSRKLLLGASHLIALGLGAWWAFQPNAPNEFEGPSSSPSSSNTGYRISTTRLLEAFDFNSPHYREAFPKEEYLPGPSGTDRAALVSDFAGELQNQIDKFHETGWGDNDYTEALIIRWMSLDPQAAMRFMGQIKLRSGWGDPWEALFRNPCQLDGIQLFTIIRNTWLPNNHRQGLHDFASMIGRNHPDQLPAILASQESDSTEAKTILTTALSSAQIPDLQTWLTTIASLSDSEQEKAYQTLSKALIPSSPPYTRRNPEAATRGKKPPSITELKTLISNHSGTPIGVLLKERLDKLLAQFRQPPNPPSHDTKTPNLKNSQEVKRWLQHSNAREFQQVLSGNASFDSALKNQFALIETQIPEEMRNELYGELVSEAFFIDPATTLALAKESLSPKELHHAINETITGRYSSGSIQQTSLLYSTLAQTPYWNEIKFLPNHFPHIIHEYHQHHSGLAAEWIRSLPTELIDSTLQSPSTWQSVREAITKARSQ